MSAILIDTSDGLMRITLNRPDCQNSLVAEVYAEIIAAAREAEADPDVRVILFRAAGKNFCLGADAGNLDSYSDRGLVDTFQQDFHGKIGLQGGVGGALDELGIGAWALAFASIEKPVVCAIQGIAAGGGFALAMLPHFRIAARDARFVSAFPKLGLGCEMGLSATLPAVCGRQKALDILLSSRPVGAEEAFEIGVVDRLSDPDDLEKAAEKYAREFVSMAPLAVRATLRQLRRAWLKELRAALEVEWRDQSVLFSSADFKEGVKAFAERRTPEFSGR